MTHDDLARQALPGLIARDMAHDINDLLVGIVTFGEEAAGLKGLDEMRRAVRAITEYGRRIAVLVRAYQESFPSNEGAGTGSEPGPADVEQALDRSLLLCQHRISARGVVVEKGYENLPRAQAGAGCMEQTFIALFLEVLGTMFGGGVLSVTAESTGDRVAVSISAKGREPLSGGEHAGPRACVVTSAGGGVPDVLEGEGTLHLGRRATQAAVHACGGKLTEDITLGRFSTRKVVFPIFQAH